MINKPSPFKGLNIKIPIIIPIKGRGFINQGSGVLSNQNNIEAHVVHFVGTIVFANGSFSK